MSLQPIEIPESIKHLAIASEAERLIDTANERIEAFLLANESVKDSFVPCDFHLLDQALTWITDHHLLAGNQFCELGSGIGVGAMLASLRGMHAVGIEIQSDLVQESIDLSDDEGISASFFCGSFVPRDIPQLTEIASEMERVETEEGDIYDEIGMTLDEFDLVFAFPWPGEHTFFETVFDGCAADGALLLTYRGRDGMHLLRKM